MPPSPPTSDPPPTPSGDGAGPDLPPDAARRRRVAVAGFDGDAATARRHLGDTSPAVRATALGALARLGALSDDDLSAALADPAAGVRRRAALIAAAHPGRADGLPGLLTDDDDTVAEAAAFALGERPGTVAVVAALAEVATTHRDALCREAAVASLGSLGDPAGAPAVLAACGDRATVRRRAVLALAAFDGPEVSRMLRTMASDRDLQVRQAAEDLLAIEEGEEV